ncbi:MAG: hypothetical protein LBE76_08055 [Nitrososphaerota archaeon]|nr:hypothetical protein [Nitrososphaerota archaeon]
MKNFGSTLNIKQLQQHLIRTITELNRKPFCFEEITIPTIPNSEVIFEFGLADGKYFNFLNIQEAKCACDTVIKYRQVSVLDFFCVIRYYRCNVQKRIALKFDYYMLRVNFAAKRAEFRVFHKQGLRYINPEDLVMMIVNKINKLAVKPVLDENVQELSEF